jgi:hypothetical protein
MTPDTKALLAGVRQLTADFRAELPTPRTHGPRRRSRLPREMRKQIAALRARLRAAPLMDAVTRRLRDGLAKLDGRRTADPPAPAPSPPPTWWSGGQGRPGIIETVASEFDAAEGGLQDLARMAAGIDRAATRATLHGEAATVGGATWFEERINQPLWRLAKYEAAAAQLRDTLANERATRARLGDMLVQLRARHDATPIGSQQRKQLESRIERSVQDETRLNTDIERLERCEIVAARIGENLVVDKAKVGLAAYMEVAGAVAAELLKRDLEPAAQTLTGEARRLLDAFARHETLIARVAQATGQPARIPRVRHGAHEALVALGLTATVELEVPPPLTATDGPQPVAQRDR